MEGVSRETFSFRESGSSAVSLLKFKCGSNFPPEPLLRKRNVSSLSRLRHVTPFKSLVTGIWVVPRRNSSLAVLQGIFLCAAHAYLKD